MAKRKRTRSQIGRGSRRKGASAEREAAEVLRPIFPDVRRKAMQARGGAEGADLENVYPYWVEVGVGKAVSAIAKWEQAARDLAADVSGYLTDGEKPERVPIALTKRDRSEWLVTMSAEAWCDLVRKARLADSLKAALDMSIPKCAGDGMGGDCRPACAFHAAIADAEVIRNV